MFKGFDGDVRNLPENRYIEAKLVEKKWFGKKKRYILKALFVSRVERYAKYGFDTDPLELKDINVHIIEERDRAKEEGCTRVLCLASPTGFEDTVKEHISGKKFHKNFLSKYLSIWLNYGEGSIVKTAFYNVAEKNGWKVKFVEEVGLMLIR